MNDIETGYTIKFEADTKQMQEQLKNLNQETINFGSSVRRSFEDLIFKGKDVETVFKSLALQLSRKAFSSAFQPIETLFSLGGGQTNQSSGTSLLSSIFGFAKGGAFSSGVGTGGILNSPMAFPMGGGNVGVAGEAGPEAILPLTRGANGELGVRSSGGNPVTIHMNITTPDIESFKASQGELATSLQRIVARGSRNL